VFDTEEVLAEGAPALKLIGEPVAVAAEFVARTAAQ
jgi:hypothetical protein